MNSAKILKLAGLVLLSLPSLALAHASFAGTWSLDKAASRGLPPHVAASPKYQLTVTQTPDTLSVDIHVETGRPERPSFDQRFSYRLDAKETMVESEVLTGSGPIKVPTTLRAEPSKDGSLLLTITRELSRGGDTLRVVTKEIWKLTDEGKRLSIHRDDERPDGSHTVYDMAFGKQ